MLFACTHKTSEVHEEVQELTEADLMSESGGFIPLYDTLSVLDRQKIHQFYAANDYKPVFTFKKGLLTETGKVLQSIIDNGLYYGIPQNRLYLPVTKDSLKQEFISFIKDVQLSIGFLRLLDDLKNGFSDSLKMQQRQLGLLEIHHLDSIKIRKEKQEIIHCIESFAPENKAYQMLAKELKNYVDTLDKFLKLFPVTLSSKDSVTAYSNALKNLKLKKFPLEETENPRIVIKRYQKYIGVSADGKIDEATLHSLEETPLDIAYRIAWAMEKTRHAVELPKQFIRINIPEFKLYYFNEDTIASIHQVVVGRLANKTPTLQSKINRIITFPYWNVPFSIATKEILPAVKRSVQYLEKNQMEIMRGNI